MVATIDSLRPGAKGVSLVVKVCCPGPRSTGSYGKDLTPVHAGTCEQVIDAKVVVDRPKGPKGGGTKIAECIVGDASASILFTARDDQGEVPFGFDGSSPCMAAHSCCWMDAVDLAQVGAYLSLENANIEMQRGNMRLVLDKAGGKIEVSEGQSFKPAVRMGMLNLVP